MLFLQNQHCNCIFNTYAGWLICVFSPKSPILMSWWLIKCLVFFPICVSTVELPPLPDDKDKTCRSELLDPAAPGHDSTVAGFSEGGLFTGKRFLLVGFGPEAEAQLSMLVVENYGKVLVGRFRGVADYAVVPLLGCEVEATVGEVVTDTWLVRWQNVWK